MSEDTVAITQKSGKKPFDKLQTLLIQASLILGFLADFQAAGGRTLLKVVLIPNPDKSKRKGLKIYLAIEGHDLDVVSTPDGEAVSVDGKHL